jgi:hypothetical protein
MESCLNEQAFNWVGGLLGRIITITSTTWAINYCMSPVLTVDTFNGIFERYLPQILEILVQKVVDSC